MTGVCSAGKLDFVRSLGADHVSTTRAVDYTSTGERYDWILDTDSHHSILRDPPRAAAGAASTSRSAGPARRIVASLIVGPLISLASDASGPACCCGGSRSRRRTSQAIAALIADGKVKPVIDRRFPLSEVVEALRYVDEGHARGKVIITMDEVSRAMTDQRPRRLSRELPGRGVQRRGLLDRDHAARARARGPGDARRVRRTSSLDEWVSYVAYLAAFANIGVLWMGHHTAFSRIRAVDSGLMWRNLVLLLTVSVVPFPTAVIASAYRVGSPPTRRPRSCRTRWSGWRPASPGCCCSATSRGHPNLSDPISHDDFFRLTEPLMTLVGYGVAAVDRLVRQSRVSRSRSSWSSRSCTCSASGAPSTDGPDMSTVVEQQRGPNLLVRFVWWLFIGWWASGIVVAIAWLALITILGIPLGIYLINRLPTVLTLRPRSRTWTLGQDDEGRTVVTEAGRPQVGWLIRGIWFVLVGWWASAIWMGLAWLIQLTVIGIPIALLMFNRTPFVASLYRY